MAIFRGCRVHKSQEPVCGPERLWWAKPVRGTLSFRNLVELFEQTIQFGLCFDDLARFHEGLELFFHITRYLPVLKSCPICVSDPAITPANNSGLLRSCSCLTPAWMALPKKAERCCTSASISTRLKLPVG